MKIKALGHVVLRVTDRERAESFYGGVLGLPICAPAVMDGTGCRTTTMLDPPLSWSRDLHV